MSQEDDKTPVIEMTEESWEEDTAEVDVSELGETLEEADDDPESVPSGTADTRRSQQLQEEFPLVPASAPLQALRPPRSAAVDLRASDRPPFVEPVVTDSQPPSSRTFGFLSSAATKPPPSLGQQFARARRVGTGTWYAGAVLWAYLVVGEYVVGAGLPEFVGWSLFSGVVVGGFLHGANRVGTQVMGRVAAFAVASILAGVLLFSAALGSSQQSEYQSGSVVLLLAAIALIFWGMRFSRGGLPRLPRPGTNWPRLVLWVAFVGNTAVVLLSLLGQT